MLAVVKEDLASVIVHYVTVCHSPRRRRFGQIWLGGLYSLVAQNFFH